MNVDDSKLINWYLETFERFFPKPSICNCKNCFEKPLATASDDGTKESTRHYHKPEHDANNPSPAKRTIAMPGEPYEINISNIKPTQYSDEEEIKSRNQNNTDEWEIQNYVGIKRKELQKLEEFPAKKNKAGISVIKNAGEPSFISGSEETVINNDTFRHKNGDKVNKLQVPDLNALTYEVERFSRNAMIIFNHEHFICQTRRAGTDRDVTALEQTFKRFRFEVTTYNDLNKKPLFEELQKFGKQNFEDCGCICVVILTHGNDHGYLRAADVRYTERELFACLDTQKNPSLVAKPIIFLIQACRGDHLAKTVMAMAQSGGACSVELDTEIENQSRSLLPTEADMIIFHSCFIGRASVRVVSEGTWFIQTLCEQLNSYASTEHLEDIFRRVRKIIALEKGFENAKQMPVMSSTLLRKLYLLPQGNLRAEYCVNHTNNLVETVRFDANHDAIRGKIYLVAEHAPIGIALTIAYCCLLYSSVVREHIVFFISLLFVYMVYFDVSWKKMLASSVLLFVFLKIAGVDITWEVVRFLKVLTS